MNAPVEFAFVNARLRALLNELWEPARVHRSLRDGCGGSATATADMTTVYTPLVRWYVTLVEGGTATREVLLAFVRLAELGNLKLLWRAAVRSRRLPLACWRPLGPLATIFPSDATISLHALVTRLAGTPYSALAVETERSHGNDLLAAELALDGWALAALHDSAVRLPARERRARALVEAWLREREVDLLRRAAGSYGIEAAFAVSLTRVLRRECDRASLIALAAWEPRDGRPFELPSALRRAGGSGGDWRSLISALGRARARLCRRALLGYPFQAAPIVAGILLREAQACAELSLAAGGAYPGGRSALPFAAGLVALGG